MSRLNVEKAFASAVVEHQAGRISKAESLYRQILAQQPDHAGALYYLGVIAHRMGRNDAAVELIRKVVAIQPEN